jgi:hypothetical protein
LLILKRCTDRAEVIGRICLSPAAPEATPWMWTPRLRAMTGPQRATSSLERRNMLTFDDQFASGQPVPRVQDGVNFLGCVLWADASDKRRVRFYIGPLILEDVLHGGKPVHDDKNVELCVRERSRIEAACRRAFASRPSVYIALQPFDFP